MKYHVGSHNDCVHLTAALTVPPLVNDEQVSDRYCQWSRANLEVGENMVIISPNKESIWQWYPLDRNGNDCYFRKKVTGRRACWFNESKWNTPTSSLARAWNHMVLNGLVLKAFEKIWRTLILWVRSQISLLETACRSHIDYALLNPAWYKGLSFLFTITMGYNAGYC